MNDPEKQKSLEKFLKKYKLVKKFVNKLLILKDLGIEYNR